MSTVSDITSDWILDSGCTYHMTCNKDWLSDFKQLEGGKVIMGNSQTCQVKGVGKVNIKMFDGIVRTLKDLGTYLVSRETLLL